MMKLMQSIRARYTARTAKRAAIARCLEYMETELEALRVLRAFLSLMQNYTVGDADASILCAETHNCLLEISERLQDSSCERVLKNGALDLEIWILEERMRKIRAGNTAFALIHLDARSARIEEVRAFMRTHQTQNATLVAAYRWNVEREIIALTEAIQGI